MRAAPGPEAVAAAKPSSAAAGPRRLVGATLVWWLALFARLLLDDRGGAAKYGLARPDGRCAAMRALLGPPGPAPRFGDLPDDKSWYSADVPPAGTADTDDTVTSKPPAPPPPGMRRGGDPSSMYD